MDTSIVSYHIDGCFRTCLVVPTSRKLHIVMITGRGLVARTADLDQERFMTVVNTPLKKGLASFGGIARRKGATKAARTWLAKAREGIS
jgi:hypothetical protein